MIESLGRIGGKAFEMRIKFGKLNLGIRWAEI